MLQQRRQEHQSINSVTSQVKVMSQAAAAVKGTSCCWGGGDVCGPCHVQSRLIKYTFHRIQYRNKNILALFTIIWGDGNKRRFKKSVRLGYLQDSV
jgi:hypothetical protein